MAILQEDRVRVGGSLHPYAHRHRLSLAKGPQSHSDTEIWAPEGPALCGCSAGETQRNLRFFAKFEAALMKAAGEGSGWTRCRTPENAAFVSLCEDSICAGRMEGMGVVKSGTRGREVRG